MTVVADRISGIVSLGIGAWFHVSDQYVHVVGNEIINAGYHATGSGGSWSLLNALLFDRAKTWMIIFFVMGIILLIKSAVAEFRHKREKISKS